MLRRPPRSTLFPTRRSSDLAAEIDVLEHQTIPVLVRTLLTELGTRTGIDRKSTRLKLQSPVHLVCRLLLEKKKIRYTNNSAIAKFTKQSSTMSAVVRFVQPY